MALVDAVEAKQIGSGAGGGGRVFVVPHDHGDVVPKWDDGATTEVDLLGNDVLLGKKASQFKMGIGDVASGVVG